MPCLLKRAAMILSAPRKQVVAVNNINSGISPQRRRFYTGNVKSGIETSRLAAAVANHPPGSLVRICKVYARGKIRNSFSIYRRS